MKVLMSNIAGEPVDITKLTAGELHAMADYRGESERVMVMKPTESWEWRCTVCGWCHRVFPARQCGMKDYKVPECQNCKEIKKQKASG